RFFRILVGWQAVFHNEIRGVLTDVGAEAGIRDVLTLISVIADENGDASRAMSCLRDEPSGGSAQLPAVGPDMSRAGGRRLVGYVGDDGLAVCLQCLDRLSNEGVIRRDHCNRITPRSKRLQPHRDVLWRQIVDELDDGVDVL